MTVLSTAKKLAEDFLSFSKSSPTPFHCVETACSLLKSAGFEQLSLRTGGSLKNLAPGGKYYFTKNGTTLVAFAIGARYIKGNGVTAMVAHSDSPGLLLKPVSKFSESGYELAGVETYGGGLFDTWFDRDLSLAGRVILERGDDKYETRLVDLEKPLLSVPRLAIHLMSLEERSKGFKPNFENHLRPILGLKNKCGSEKTEKVFFH